MDFIEAQLNSKCFERCCQSSAEVFRLQKCPNTGTCFGIVYGAEQSLATRSRSNCNYVIEYVQKTGNNCVSNLSLVFLCMYNSCLSSLVFDLFDEIGDDGPKSILKF
jgi:hypothetical protein